MQCYCLCRSFRQEALLAHLRQRYVTQMSSTLQRQTSDDDGTPLRKLAQYTDAIFVREVRGC